MVRGGEQTLQQACSQEYPGSARCVQSFDDSLDSAIRITYRISLRSSSMWEPRHPSLKVVLDFRLSAAQVRLLLRLKSNEANHAEYAALGFSVSQWRQIELVWVSNFCLEVCHLPLMKEMRHRAHGCMSLRTF